MLRKRIREQFSHTFLPAMITLPASCLTCEDDGWLTFRDLLYGKNWPLDNWYLPITINSVLGRDAQFFVTNLCRVSAMIKSEHVLCCKITCITFIEVYSSSLMIMPHCSL